MSWRTRARTVSRGACISDCRCSYAKGLAKASASWTCRCSYNKGSPSFSGNTSGRRGLPGTGNSRRATSDAFRIRAKRRQAEAPCWGRTRSDKHTCCSSFRWCRDNTATADRRCSSWSCSTMS